MGMDKAHWPQCLLWHGWLPKLSGVNGASLLGLLVLLIVLVTLLNLHFVATLLVFLLNGVPLMSMMRLKLPLSFQIIPMSGLTVALFLIV